MRNEPNLRVEGYRIPYPPSDFGRNYGAFRYGPLRIISSGTPTDNTMPPWEHVSVSCAGRCPTWEEMCWVKDRFWKETEIVVQFHPDKASYVNAHPYCLHLWRNTTSEIILPPRNLLA